jgi:hypothetical protein
MFGMVTCAVSGQVRNGFPPQRREADVWDPRDTRARLAATQGRKRSGLASCVEIGPGINAVLGRRGENDPRPFFDF